MDTLIGLAVLIAVFAVAILGVRWWQERVIDRQQERAIREYLRQRK